MTDTVKNIGAGVSEAKKEKPEEDLTSTVSAKKEKQSTKPTEEPITKEDALGIFQSALNYLKEAKFKVTGFNEENQLVIVIDGWQYETGRIFISEPKSAST